MCNYELYGVGGWVEVKAFLRIPYSNQKDFSHISQIFSTKLETLHISTPSKYDYAIVYRLT